MSPVRPTSGPTTYVLNLVGCKPPARFDGLPWITAVIEEGSSDTGSWTQIDSKTLSPVDSDPTAPAVRSFTTANATEPTDWFRVVWVDAAGHTAAGDPEFIDPAAARSGAIATVDQLKEYLGVQKTASDAMLSRILNGTTTVVERLTGKRFAANPSNPDAAPVAITVSVPSPRPPRSFLFGPAAFGTPLGPQPTNAELAITIPHAREIDTLELDTTGTLASGQYMLEADSTLQDPYTRRVVILDPAMLPAQTLTITGRFGIVPAPEDLVDAVLAMCARRYKERDASWGDSVQLADGGLISYYRALPPAVRLVIDSYCEVSM